LKAEVQFLGRVATEEGLRFDPEKMVAVRNIPETKKVKQLKGFLSLSSYYRGFIHNYKNVANSL
jgi:hypothetical protein